MEAILGMYYTLFLLGIVVSIAGGIIVWTVDSLPPRDRPLLPQH